MARKKLKKRATVDEFQHRYGNTLPSLKPARVNKSLLYDIE